jgi:hypothetical protein
MITMLAFAGFVFFARGRFGGRANQIDLERECCGMPEGTP